MSTTPDIIGPSSIVTSLEWSKKLKEAGWNQKQPNFLWVEFFNTSSTVPKERLSSLIRIDEWHGCDCEQPYKDRSYLKSLSRYAAPTAEEILRRLPMDRVRLGQYFMMNVPKKGDSGNRWYVSYKKYVSREDTHEEHGDTIANAAAAMFCYLAEHKLLPNP